MAATYTPIASATIGTATATVTFSSIPQTYTDLVISYEGTSAVANGGLRFNSDTAGNYSFQRFFGEGAGGAASADGTANATYAGIMIASTGRTNAVANIMNYSNTTTYKSTISTGLTNSAEATKYNVSFFTGNWRSTSAITAVSVFTASGTFSVGSTFNLYGILAGS